MKSAITKTVKLLSLVSLCTDMASEMLYPVLPAYLRYIGFSIFFIGLLEGIAESLSGLSKPYFGRWSDRIGRRLPFVQLGYALSALSKPLLAVGSFLPLVFFARTTDRLGKGIRTAARDALLSEEATPATKATVFGYHRSMDTLGAVLGPGLALLYLYFFPQHYTGLFLLAFLPGMAAVVFTFLVRPDLPAKPAPTALPAMRGSPWQYWRSSTPAYRRLVIGLTGFALVNSSDFFLLLRLRENGMTETQVIALYIGYNLVYALLAFPLGKLADRIGTKKVFLTGLAIFGLVYTAFALGHTFLILIGALLLYGVFAAATEGVAKAWISQVSDTTQQGTAMGLYSGLQSVATLIASTLTGILWTGFGPSVALMTPVVAIILIIIYLSRTPALE
jgi:MFS family permease